MNEHPTSASPLHLDPAPGPTLDPTPVSTPGLILDGGLPLPGPDGSGPTTGRYPTDDPTGTRSGGTRPDGTRPDGEGSRAHRLFEILRRSPVRRDRDRGMIGGLCAGIARSTGLSVVAVRVIAVLSALLPGTVAGVYLLAWALLPDDDGGIHAERAMLDGRPRSLVVLTLGGMALIGMLSWALNTWPLLVGAGVVVLVLLNKLDRTRAPHHPAR